MVASPPKPAACRTCGQSFRDDLLVCPVDGATLPLEGRLLDGKFRLDRRLGHGGMASVWQATNVFVERTVAIKLMHASYAEDADLLARFRNEATAAGRIGSPHICDVLDFGRSTIGPYIVMELLSGCSFSDLIDAYQRLQPGLAVWIVRQALDGLHAAHQAGIIHRDLKPENIYLCRAIRDQWLVKLMDFGISKFNDSIRTGAGTMMGSPNYMAPEQIHGAGAVDRRADVWSIGAILYEALAGQQAFARDTVADSLAAVRSFDPPPVHTVAPEVPPGLSEIVARCLRKQPEQRWPSAAALAEALLPFERPGPRTRLLPTTPIGDVRLDDTLPRAGAARGPWPTASPHLSRAPGRSRSCPRPPGPRAPSRLSPRPAPPARPAPTRSSPGPPAPRHLSPRPAPPVPRARTRLSPRTSPAPTRPSPRAPRAPTRRSPRTPPAPTRRSRATSPAPTRPSARALRRPRPQDALRRPPARRQDHRHPRPRRGRRVPGPSTRGTARAQASDPHPVLIVVALAAIGGLAATIAWFVL
ncbi:protein kinase domain-containing protein [Nannocystis pusilla]|uniref:serine/threonine-protein kinase n=1 Tax=Nannocystis pusilla TaxID=889268 RepID=UPI003B80FBFA